jgi:hypothetical protein
MEDAGPHRLVELKEQASRARAGDSYDEEGQMCLYHYWVYRLVLRKERQLPVF